MKYVCHSVSDTRLADGLPELDRLNLQRVIEWGLGRSFSPFPERHRLGGRVSQRRSFVGDSVRRCSTVGDPCLPPHLWGVVPYFMQRLSASWSRCLMLRHTRTLRIFIHGSANASLQNGPIAVRVHTGLSSVAVLWRAMLFQVAVHGISAPPSCCTADIRI